jgi:hypothetical protein
MNLLQEIRKESNTNFSTNWFMNGDDWSCFSQGTLYTQDASVTGPESIKEITDVKLYNEILQYKKKI